MAMLHTTGIYSMHATHFTHHTDLPTFLLTACVLYHMSHED